MKCVASNIFLFLSTFPFDRFFFPLKHFMSPLYDFFWGGPKWILKPK
ncbi:hypothetical protein LEP1GSC195_2567 [Leptospira wolbachii serovar Codice str. CDC]|uniref:Uncharacterized protein n=1 Tax=Leptospira wolbachii serovar Codice str. CDC TaxID=1218599 RepID=R9A5A2_9LEPT|nr:hypothetical protein LEP1GSC195_2567 [Leptospira wolbachii serovar Codice str. CDC]